MIDKDYKISFSDDEEAVLEFISNSIVNGKRIHELVIMEALLNSNDVSEDNVKARLAELHSEIKDADIESATNVLLKNFMNTKNEKEKFENVELIDFDDNRSKQFRRAAFYSNCLKNNAFKTEVRNLIDFGIRKYVDNYTKHDRNNLVLYEKYSRKDVCRILNWVKDDSSTVYGYRIKHNTCPIFVTYNKSEDITKSIYYKDEFELIEENPDAYSNKIFSWMTRSKVSLKSKETQQIINAERDGLKLLLFLKKSDGEGADFYYMGEVKPIAWEETTISNDDGKELPIVNFKLLLENEARPDIFDYFIS